MKPHRDDPSETMACPRCIALEARLDALEARLGATTAGRTIDPDALYTVQETADRLRCGKTNAYDLLDAGELAVTRIGAGRMGLRVRGADLLAFLDARREGGPIAQGTFRHIGQYMRPRTD